MKIITGMHRSGTSFLAQALFRLGLDFGPQDLLFPADYWNQNGYFENLEVVDINNQLILGAGTPVELWLKAPEHGFDRVVNSLRSRKWKYFLKPTQSRIHGRSTKFSKRIDRLHHIYNGITVKDPRFCLTLKVWAEHGVIEDIVFSFRNPQAVASSVRRREKLPLVLGYQQWLYHIRGFWSQVDVDTPVFLVDFDRFFDARAQEEAFDRLIKYRQLPDAEVHRKALIDELDPRLRNHQSDLGNLPVDVATAYEALMFLYEACGPDGILLRDYPQQKRAILNRPSS